MSISKESYEFNHAFRHLVLSRLYFDSILNSGNVKQGAKHFVNRLRQRVNVNINDLLTLISKENAEVLKQQMLDEDLVLQVQNINDMLADMPPVLRNEAEKHVENIYNIYKQKTKS